MIHLRSRWTALFLALVLSLSLALPASAAQEDRAQAAAQYAMQYGGAVSVQYALWENGEVTLQGHDGVYSKTENRALTDDDLYGIGSISKTYTAAAMMKLVEQGKVDLDEPVTAYLPDFTMADPRYTQITVRMLLNHSSGLMGGTTNDAFLFGDQGNDDAPSRLLERRLQRLLQRQLHLGPAGHRAGQRHGVHRLSKPVPAGASGTGEHPDPYGGVRYQPAGQDLSGD